MASYPPIYIINLKRTPERKLSIQRQLDAFNLNYKFVEAVDKYDLSCKARRAIIAEGLDIKTTKMESLYDRHSNHLGTLACLLSHVKVYNLIIKNNIPYACVLEDDSELLPVFARILIAAQEISWEVLMLSSQSFLIQRILYNLYHFKFRSLYKLLYWKKYYPELTFFTVRLIISKIIKFLILPSKIIKKVAAKGQYITKKHYAGALLTDMACEIGGLPNKDMHSWHKVAAIHYLAIPETTRSNLASCMAYMLTRSAAIKWKQEALLPLSIPIDRIPAVLCKRKCLNLYIVVPPCVRASYRFLINSANCI